MLDQAEVVAGRVVDAVGEHHAHEGSRENPVIDEADCTPEEEDRVKAQGLVFLGVRTADTDVMAAFFTDVMGFPLAAKAHDFLRFQLPNRDQIELWGPSLESQAHITTGPMPEFLVHDVEQARRPNCKRRGSRF